MNTLVEIKEKIRSLVPSLLIKLSQVLSVDVGQVWPNHVKSSCYFSFILILLLCFTNFSFTNITYCHGFATSITVLSTKQLVS